MSNTNLKLREDDKIAERVPGEDVPELKRLDPGLSNYDFESLADAVEFAKIMAQAGPMLPKHAQGNAGVCLALLYRARHWGIDPFGLAMESYQAKADAPIAYQARVYTAVLINNGINLSYEYTGETHFTAEKATSSKGNQVADQTAAGTRQVTVSFPIDGEVKKYTSPMLKDIKVKNSPLWHNDPDQQLAYYAARAWARRYRPDLMMGALSVDEVQDNPQMRDVSPREEKGGFAKLGDRAREEAKEVEVEDAELDQTDNVGGLDPDVTDPAYLNGLQAAKGGLSRGDCPYRDNPDQAELWFEGFDFFTEAEEDTAEDEDQDQ